MNFHTKQLILLFLLNLFFLAMGVIALYGIVCYFIFHTRGQ